MKYEAFKVIPVVQRLSHKVESVSAWDKDKLLCGTSDGTLLVLDLADNIDNNDPATISVAHKNFSKKAITQLTACNEIDLLVCMSDGVISTYDLPSCKHRTTLRSRGFTIYRINETRADLPLVAATKKKLCVFEWDGGDFLELRDFPLVDVPRTLEWAGKSVCVGYKRLYVMIDTSNGRTTELFPTGKTGQPHARALPSDELLLTKDNIGIFLGFDGKPTRKFGLGWSDTPLALGYSYPYVIAVLPKFIEIRMMLTQTLVQTVNAPFAAITANHQDVFAVGAGAIYRLHPVPVLKQVNELVDRNEYAEAITLCKSVTEDRNAREKKEREQRLVTIQMAYAFDLMGQRQFVDAMTNFEGSQCDPRVVLAVFPDLLPRNVKEKLESENPELALLPALDNEDLVKKASASLITYLKAIRMSDTYADAQPADDAGRRAFTSVCASSAPGDIRQVVDTCLLKAYLINNDEFLTQFLLAPNQCHTDEAERSLRVHQKSAELILFHRSRGQHRAALELLKTIANTPGEAVSSALQGYAPSIQYMQALGPEDLELVLEYSRWVLEGDAERGLQIFTCDPVPPAKLPPRAVLAHLKRVAPLQCVAYLEHIILTHKNDSSDLHDELILLYLDQTTALLRESAYQNTPASDGTPLPHAGDEPGLLGEYRRKLIRFLETSDRYHPEKMLSRFPINELYEERALLLSRIGQHDQALTIYALKLNDAQVAEDYCERFYNPESEETKDIYLSLLQAYLHPPDDSPPRMEPALVILNKYFGRIDAARALQLIPTTTKLRDLEPFCEAYFQNDLTGRRNNQVVKNLLKSENLVVHENLIRNRSRVVRISADRMCQACNKRIGTSVFACYPNGVVVHFVCSKDKNICPVTGEDFRKTNKSYMNDV